MKKWSIKVMWLILAALYFCIALVLTLNAREMGWIFIPTIYIDLFLMVHSVWKLCE